MNPIFSFHRIKLLVIRYLAESGRRDLITLFAFLFTFAFLPRIMDSQSGSFPLFCLVLFIGGMRFTARIFHDIHPPGSGMHFFHIPSSRLEKFILNGGFTLLFYPIVCFLLYVGGTLFGNFIGLLMPSFLNYPIVDLSSIFQVEPYVKMIPYYICCHAVFFLGSLFFKKHPTTKTFVSIIAICFAISTVQMILVNLLWSGIEIESMNALPQKIVQLVESVVDSSLLKNVQILSNILLTMFLWVVSYLKLKEKQV